MALATATRDGRPSVRTVLLKGVDPRGFVFYTNYHSRKAREIEQTGRASLLFVWRSVDRQVRVDGRVEKVSDGRFRRLLRDASAREPLERLRVAPERDDREPRSAGIALRRRPPDVRRRRSAPAWWGGYRVVPDEIRVLAGTRQPAARSAAVPPAGRRLLVARAAGSLSSSHEASVAFVVEFCYRRRHGSEVLP